MKNFERKHHTTTICAYPMKSLKGMKGISATPPPPLGSIIGFAQPTHKEFAAEPRTIRSYKHCKKRRTKCVNVGRVIRSYFTCFRRHPNSKMRKLLTLRSWYQKVFIMKKLFRKSLDLIFEKQSIELVNKYDWIIHIIIWIALS